MHRALCVYIFKTVLLLNTVFNLCSFFMEEVGDHILPVFDVMHCLLLYATNWRWVLKNILNFCMPAVTLDRYCGKINELVPFIILW